MRGADAVAHLTWVVQPDHRGSEIPAANADGTRRVDQAVTAGGVPALVHQSAFAAYSGAADRAVDESRPTDGIPTSRYSRQKAEVDDALDVFADEHPHVTGPDQLTTM